MNSDRFADLKPAVRGLGDDPFRRSENYVSLRWKLVLPLFAFMLAGAMVITYIVAATLQSNGSTAQTSQIQLAARGAQNSMQNVYQTLNHDAIRLAALQDIGAVVTAGDTPMLQRMLEPEAVAAGLDSIVVLDTGGYEVLGLHRSSPESRTNYQISTGLDLSTQPLVQAFHDSGRAGVTGLLRTPQGYMVYVIQPVMHGSQKAGAMLAGRYLERVLDWVRSGSLTQVALFDLQGNLLQSTFRAQGGAYDMLALTPEQAAQVLTQPGVLPVQSIQFNGYPYQEASLPFVLGQDALGVMSVFLPASLPYAADLSRQLLSLLMATLAAVVVIAGYVGVARVVHRIQRVNMTTRALAGGDFAARTSMQPVDEIGELGHTLDVYADRVQQRQDSLRTMLRRQRRENARMTAIFESIPDGVIVQDVDGRVLLINETARDLIGSHYELEGEEVSALTAAVTDVIGPALAPGIYTLGEPRRIPLAGAVLSAQAAAILTISGRRVGTVTVLRDITEEVYQEQVRAELLQKLTRDVQEPLMELVTMRSPADADPPMQRFAYEVMRNAVRLQRLVMQIRDLSDLGPEQLEVGQLPLPVDSLLHSFAAEWEGAARAADLSLHVNVQHEDMFVLGDERRLRWALGNLLDNAIKYTLAGGKISLTARRQSQSYAEVIIEDNGVGISQQEMAHIFTRFYRGTPQLPDGTLLRVPGMGQGLFIAKQVIEAHGGALTVHSTRFEGTQAICRLPLTSPVAMAIDFSPPAETGLVASNLQAVARDRPRPSPPPNST